MLALRGFMPASLPAGEELSPGRSHISTISHKKALKAVTFADYFQPVFFLFEQVVFISRLQ